MVTSRSEIRELFSLPLSYQYSVDPLSVSSQFFPEDDYWQGNCEIAVVEALEMLFNISIPKSMRTSEIYSCMNDIVITCNRDRQVRKQLRGWRDGLQYFKKINDEQPIQEGDILLVGKNNLNMDSEIDRRKLHSTICICTTPLLFLHATNQSKKNSIYPNSDIQIWNLSDFLESQKYCNIYAVRRVLSAWEFGRVNHDKIVRRKGNT